MFSKFLNFANRPRQFFTRNTSFFSQKKPSVNNLIKDSKLVEQRSKSTYLNIALACFVFAGCFAAIPIYRTFCEHLGLTGDSNKK